MARLLANLALIQAHYPPLLLRSGPDRGQYLDALAASDEGDILPLYDLFTKSLRRVVRVMEKPGYVESKIRDELLTTADQRRDAWKGLASTLFTCLEQKARTTDSSVVLMGYPSSEDLDLAAECNPDGNCWFAKIRDRRRGADDWLLWCGYRSDEMAGCLGGTRHWPSIYFARRTSDPRSVNRFQNRFRAEGRRPAEISLVPGRAKPATVRWDLHTEDMLIDEAAAVIARALYR